MPLALCVRNVLSLRALNEMRGVATPRIVAGVAYNKTFSRPSTVMREEGNAMCPIGMRPDVKHAIRLIGLVFLDAPLPFPAVIRIAPIDTRPQALDKRLVFLRHVMCLLNVRGEQVSKVRVRGERAQRRGGAADQQSHKIRVACCTAPAARRARCERLRGLCALACSMCWRSCPWRPRSGRIHVSIPSPFDRAHRKPAAR